MNSEARRWTRPLLAGLVLFASGASLAAQQDTTRPAIAVLAFENGGSYGQDRENYEGLSRGVAGLLQSQLGRNPAVRLIERSEAQRLLDEQSLGAAGRLDRETAARVGKLAGARYVIAGTFIDLYGDFRLYARIIDAQTGQILLVARPPASLVEIKDLDRMVQNLATQIFTQIKLPPGPARVARNIPPQALTMYGRALLYEDRGERARAAEYYQQAIDFFPGFSEAGEGLRRLRPGAS